MPPIFPKSLKPVTRSKLQSQTLHGFGGGWNAVDDDTVMAGRYLKTLINFRRTTNGGQKLRWGQQFFVDLANVITFELREDGGFELREDGGFELRDFPINGGSVNIVDCVYFNNRIVAVTTSGWIYSVDDLVNVSVIWSPVLAALLPGAPAGWSTNITGVDFVPSKNTMIIHNGVDKPVTISSSFAVTYLQDLATGSNVNVPIGKYGCIASNYHCVAGFANAPTQLVISAQGTDGVFPLDPAPNDSITIDIGAYAPDGAASIRGIAGYRSYLIVFLQNINIQIQLGIYDSATPTPNHTPKFPDTFPSFGLLGSRCIAKIDSDLAFGGYQGLTTAKRNSYVNTQLDNNLMSSLVEPVYQKTMGALTETQKLLNTFAVFDQLNHDFLIFEPSGSVFCYSSNEKLNYKSWSQYQNMHWTSGCTSLLGRLFLTTGSKIFQSGNETYGEKYTGDKLLDRTGVWAKGIQYFVGNIEYDSVTQESYTCNVSHTSTVSGTFVNDRLANPSFWTKYLGIPIAFDMEMPWFKGRDPMQVKMTRFISVGARGTAEFTVSMYVDDLYKDVNGSEIFPPALSMTFIGNSAPGYGVETAEGPYGTGRRATDPRLYKFGAKFKSAKFRIQGSTVAPLEITSFSFLFSRGSFFR